MTPYRLATSQPMLLTSAVIFKMNIDKTYFIAHFIGYLPLVGALRSTMIAAGVRLVNSVSGTWDGEEGQVLPIGDVWTQETQKPTVHKLP